jgi:ipoprotein LpqH
MPNRVGASAPVAFVAGGAALAMFALGACSSGSQAASSASVSVDGSNTTIHVVKCSQLDWYKTIDIGGELAGATVTIDARGQDAKATAVRIRNVGGFTGLYSLGGNGDANMSFSGDKYTITGTANGYKTDKPNEPASAAFKISTTC